MNRRGGILNIPAAHDLSLCPTHGHIVAHDNELHIACLARVLSGVLFFCQTKIQNISRVVSGLRFSNEGPRGSVGGRIYLTIMTVLAIMSEDVESYRTNNSYPFSFSVRSIPLLTWAGFGEAKMLPQTAARVWR